MKLSARSLDHIHINGSHSNKQKQLVIQIRSTMLKVMANALAVTAKAIAGARTARLLAARQRGS